MIAESPAQADLLPGVLVALDLQGISLRADGVTLRARPVERLDAETRQLLADAKPALLEHLALSESERRRRILEAYEAVLLAFGRDVQRLYQEHGRQSDAALTAERGWLVALARYETLCSEPQA